jgi:hypothetical protein
MDFCIIWGAYVRNCRNLSLEYKQEQCRLLAQCSPLIDFDDRPLTSMETVIRLSCNVFAQALKRQQSNLAGLVRKEEQKRPTRRSIKGQ